MDSALYRRYRPQTFAEVIGQEHVTEPLMAALRSGRISHAFLFSGPRGCGKTSSARILARCLNCEQGPTDVPCGECESCLELGLGGRGSLDVVEIDAASHNGVDDARDLRERALANPTRDRFKIFILDEAHMVTPQGFNALLKIVEEPPPHVKFIFATTEADKVIGTIRSRTHHYPFRLVPPEKMTTFLAQICEREGIEVEDGVLPLVVRAGAGSVRDAESVLDQLMAGADGGSIRYDSAVALLGYTPATLLDETVEAFANDDGAALFSVVDQVIEGGQDPRRFAEDLLERMRDLIVIAAAGDKARSVLHSLPEDQLARMRATAERFGLGGLSRAADLINDGLASMTGATAPRLQLELLCARVIAPDATPQSAPEAVPAPSAPDHSDTTVAGTSSRQPQRTRPPQPAPPTERPAPSAPTAVPPPDTAAAGAGPTADMVSANWERLVDEVSRIRKASWALLRDNAHLVSVEGNALTLGFVSANLVGAFNNGGHAATIGEAIQRVFGSPLQVKAIVEGSTPPADRRAAPLVPAATPADPSPAHEASAAGAASPPGTQRPANVVPIDPARLGGDALPAPAGAQTGIASDPTPTDTAVSTGRPPLRVVPATPPAPATPPEAAAPTSPEFDPSAQPDQPEPDPAPRTAARPDPDDLPQDDDVEVDSATDIGAALVEKMLGGTIIDETTDDDS